MHAARRPVINTTQNEMKQKSSELEAYFPVVALYWDRVKNLEVYILDLGMKMCERKSRAMRLKDKPVVLLVIYLRLY
jgi:hypothetical protein